VPQSRREHVLKLAHETGAHLVIRKISERIRMSFLWNGLKEDVKNFVNSCHYCQLGLRLRLKASNRVPITPIPEQPDRLKWLWLILLVLYNLRPVLRNTNIYWVLWILFRVLRVLICLRTLQQNLDLHAKPYCNRGDETYIYCKLWVRHLRVNSSLWVNVGIARQ